MYSPLQRVVSIFLLLSFFLQSCISHVQPGYTAPVEAPLTRDAKEDSALLLNATAVAEDQGHEPRLLPTRTQDACLSSLLSLPADFNNKVFTGAAGEKISFFKQDGVWQAKVVAANNLGLDVGTTLPVVHERRGNIVSLLQKLAQQRSNLNKHHIHILDTSQGKCVFVGALGLKGGMQPGKGKTARPLDLAVQIGDSQVAKAEASLNVGIPEPVFQAAEEEKQAALNRSATLFTQSDRGDDSTLSTHGLNNDRYWYSIPDGMRLNLAIRQNLLDYTQIPTKVGEAYSALSENNNRIFLADPYHIDNFASSLQDDINVLLSRWQQMPTTLLLPFLEGMHWRLVQVKINYKQKSVTVWLDDPYGKNHFPASMRDLIIDIILQEVSKLIQKEIHNSGFKLPKENIAQSEKELDQQGSGQHDWDCGPIVFSNLVDYIQAVRENKAVSYSLGVYKEKDHREKLLKLRESHYLAYCKVQGFNLDTNKLAYLKNYLASVSTAKLRHYTNLATDINPTLLEAIYELSTTDLEIFFTILENKRIAEQRNVIVCYSQEELVYAYEVVCADKSHTNSSQDFAKKVALDQALVEKVQAGLRNHYQHTFAQVKSWFEGGPAALSMEKAQFHLQAKQLAMDKQGFAWHKTSIELADLFKPRSIQVGNSPQEIQKLLVVGEAGIGKTTMSHKLAYLWSQGQGDPSLETVYVLPVKDLQQTQYDNNGHFSREATLATAITNLCFPGVYSETEYKQLRAGIQVTLQNPATLVVLDGLDARSGVPTNLLEEAYQGKHKLLLLSCPDALEAVRKKVDLEVTHMGLTHNQIKAYIQDYFSDQRHKGNALWQLICNNMLLPSILQLPGNLAILCHIWAMDAAPLQAGSIAALYDKLITYAWECYVAKTAKARGLKARLGHQEKSVLFHALGCIAFEALAKNEVVISAATVNKVIDNLREKETLTRLFDDTSLSLFQRVGNGYEFPHLLLQEYFAGRELGRRLLADEPLVQQQAQACLGVYQYQSRYRMLCRFMAGEVYKINGQAGICLLLRALRNSPQEILGIHQVGIELVCLHEYLSTNPTGLVELEKEFHCLAQLQEWLEKAIQDIQATAEGGELFESLIAMLCNMPAIVQTQAGKTYIELLLKAACDENWHVRAATIKALGSLVQVAPCHASQVLKALLRAAEDQNHEVCTTTLHAFQALLQAQPLYAEKVLVSILNILRRHKKQPVPEIALNNLERIIQIVPVYQILPKLVRAIGTDQSPCLRQAALSALGSLAKFAPAYAGDMLLPLLRVTDEQEANVRHVALESLISLVEAGPDYSLQSLVYLIMATKNQEESVRVDIVKALGAFVKVVPAYAEEILKVLLKTAEDQEASVQEHSLYALEALVEAVPCHAAQVLPVLLKAAEEKDPSWCLVRQAAIKALVSLVKVAPAYTERIVPSILRAAEDKESVDTRETGIKLLLPLLEAAPAYRTKIVLCLLRAVGDEALAVSQTAKNSLASLVRVPAYIEQVLPSLLNAAEGELWSVRRAARRALVHLVQTTPSYAVKLLPYLVQAVEDPDKDVREAARLALVALVKVGPNYITKMLPSLLQATTDKHADIREATIKTLGSLVEAAPACAIQVFPYLLSAAECDDVAHVCEAALVGLMGLVRVKPSYAAEILPTFIRIAANQESMVCTAAIYALGCLGQCNPVYIEKILFCLLNIVEVNQDSYHACQAALRAIKCLLETELGHMDHVLTSLLKATSVNQSWFVRKAVLKFLVEFLAIAPSYAPQVLKNFLESAESDNNVYVQDAARKAIVALMASVPSCTEHVLPAILRAVHDKSPAMRYVGIRGLITILQQANLAYVPTILPYIADATDDTNDEVREAATKALRECSLVCLVPGYLATANSKLIPFIVPKTYQTPLVVQKNMSQGDQNLLICYPPGAQPQQLGTYTSQQVRELLELLQKPANDPHTLKEVEEKAY
jgi:HEAT repeat protein